MCFNSLINSGYGLEIGLSIFLLGPYMARRALVYYRLGLDEEGTKLSYVCFIDEKA